MFRFFRSCAAVAAVLTLLVVGSAGAASRGSSVLPAPDKLVLAPADVPGSAVGFSGFLPGQALPQYARTFMPKHSGPVVEAVLIMHPDAVHAAAIVSALNTYAQTSAGRAALASAEAAGIRSAVASPAFRAAMHITGAPAVSRVVVGNPSQPAADTTVLPHTVTVAGITLHALIAYVQVDRAIDAIEVILPQRSPSSTVLAGLIAKARARMRAGFRIANTTPPTIGGTAQVGQTLTADSGDWNGGASDLTYAWQRCSADGSTCSPIAGATAPSYVLSTADSGSTIRVTVTATNTVSQAQATSTQTTLIA